jgi:hypothetical protein
VRAQRAEISLFGTAFYKEFSCFRESSPNTRRLGGGWARPPDCDDLRKDVLVHGTLYVRVGQRDLVAQIVHLVGQLRTLHHHQLAIQL